MNKYSKIACAFLLLTHLNPLQANENSGFMLRASLGYVDAGFKQSGQVRANASGNTSNYGGTYNIKASGDNISYGLGVGYWFNQFKKMPYALEILGMVDNASFNRDSLSMLKNNAPSMQDNISGKLRGSIGIYFKPGYEVSQGILTYLFIGPKLGRFVVNSTSTFEFIGGGAQHYLGTLIGSASSTKLGYGLGIGGQYSVFKNILVGIEYTFSCYNNVKTPGYASTGIYDINTNAFFGDLVKSYGNMSVQTSTIALNVLYKL